MFTGNRFSDHMNHGATTFAGLITMAADGVLFTWVGAVVGLVGMLCSVSREVRGFLDWLDARRARRKGD